MAAVDARDGRSRRRGGRAVALAVLLLVSLAVPAAGTARDAGDACAEAPSGRFPDVTEENVHHERVDCIAHYEITLGRDDGTYGPADTLRRDALASFLDRTLRAGGYPLADSPQDYYDDTEGNVHRDAINRLAHAGVLDTSTRTFGVAVTPTRAEMAQWTARALAIAGTLPLNDEAPEFFADVTGYAEAHEIHHLADAGIITGTGPGTYAPDANLRRDQMATFLARAIDLLQDGPDSHHHCRITTPERPRFDEWYSQQCDVFGIAVVGSERVDPAALTATVDVLLGMLGRSPEVHAQLASTDFYVAIIGEEEGVTDLPEYRYLKEDESTDWDERSRGFGGTDLASAGEENILCRESDRYHGESILVHELSHSIMDGAIPPLDPDFESRIVAAFDDARADGRWQDTYADDNRFEYWAEGVQSFFDSNLSASPPDGIHNHVDTREELREYDRALHDLVAEFLDAPWRWSCP